MTRLAIFLLIISQLLAPQIAFATEEKIAVELSNTKSIIGGLVKIDYLVKKSSGTIKWMHPGKVKNCLILAQLVKDTSIKESIFLRYRLYVTATNPGEVIIDSFPVIVINNTLSYTFKTPKVKLNFIADKPIEAIGPLANIEMLSKKSILLISAKILLIILLLTLPIYYWRNRFITVKPEIHNQSWALHHLHNLSVLITSKDQDIDLPTMAFRILKLYLIYIGFPINQNDSEESLLTKLSLPLNQQMEVRFRMILTNCQTAKFSYVNSLSTSQLNDVINFVREVAPLFNNQKKR